MEKTKWQVGDKLRLLDVSQISCNPSRKNGDVLIVKELAGNRNPETECGLTFYDEEMQYVEKAEPEVPLSHRAVREYFDELVDREEQLEHVGIHGGQHRQGWLSVRRTLDLLGVKIDGVNK